jgi:hypothetical protein
VNPSTWLYNNLAHVLAAVASAASELDACVQENPITQEVSHRGESV